MQSSRSELLKKEFAALIDDINTVQREITREKNISDSQKATGLWYNIVKKQIDTMKVELNKIREAYNINDEVLHKNGIGSAVAGLAQQQYNDLLCDENGAVEELEQPSSTMETNNRTGIEENGVTNSVVSSEETGEQEHDVLQDGLSLAVGVDIDVNNDNISAYDEPLDVDIVGYVEEEVHETVKEMANTHEEGSSNINNSKVNGDVINEEKQKESDGKQDFEQLESTQSSQPVSSSSSSYNPSPVAHRKGTRVSVHRELDVNYDQSTAENGNWQLCLGQNILIRSTKDNQWYPGVILDISYRNCRAYRYQVLSEGKRSRVKGSDLALIDHCSDTLGIAVGSRIVGVYGALEVIYAGIVAEIPCKENLHRVLIFFDDGFAQYTTLDKIHLVCESGCNIWEEVARHSREFIQRYLDSYPIRPMVRLKVDEELCVEWRGRWMKAIVTQVDCSLVGVLYVESRLHEWLYRGSTRLEPIFLALTSKKGQQLSVPQKKYRQRVECSSKKRFLIVYDHFDSYTMKASSSNIKDNTGIMSLLTNYSDKDSDTTTTTTAVDTPNNDDDDDDDEDTVSMATNNLSPPTISVTEPQSPLATLAVADSGSSGREVTDCLGDACSSECSDLETLTPADQRDMGPGTRTDVSPLMIKMELCKQRLRRGSPSSKGPPSKRLCQSRESQQPPEEFHKECSSSCVSNGPAQLNDFYNALAIPLLNGWTRKLMEVNTEISHSTHHRTHIYYVTPCGRRLRSIAEVDKYLAQTETTYLSIDQFCYNSSIAIGINAISRPTNAKYYCEDISEGKERTPVSCINELQDQPPPTFSYCIDRVCSDDVIINTDQSFLIGCDCTDGCRDPTKCACACLTMEEGTCMVSRLSAAPGYNYRRLDKDQQSAIYECNSNCRCSSNCVNRVVQLGLQLRLQVFRTENKGWGLRCLDDIPKGTFVCTYSGDIHTDDSADEVCNYHPRGDEYFAELDYIEVMERHKEGYESEIEVSSLDYLSDEFTMQSSEEDEAPEHSDSIKQRQLTPQQQGDGSSASTDAVKTPLNKAGLKLHKLKAKVLSSPTLSSDSSPDPLPSRKQNKVNSPLAEVVVCDSASSDDDDDDDEQFPCYFPKYSLTEDSEVRSPSSSPALSDSSDKEEAIERYDVEPVTEHDSLRISSNCTNNTLTSSILLHSMRRKLFNETQCYVMDAKRQGNIGRFLNHSCQPNLFVQNVFVDTHDLRFPWVAFFTNQNVKALTELTWDYNYEVGSVPDKELPCYCGTINCRKRLL